MQNTQTEVKAQHNTYMARGDEHKGVIAVETVGPVSHLHRYGVQRSSALDVEQGSVRLLNRSAAAVAEARGIATYCEEKGRLEIYQ